MGMAEIETLTRQGVASWPDASLVEAVRREPPDEAALDALVARHWKALFGRCQMLALNQDQARDLAQETWCRVLRSRQSLKPDGNLPAYLTTIATNLWRDSYRAARRAGPMADHQLASLDGGPCNDEGEPMVLMNTVQDLQGLSPEQQSLLKLDLDEALAQLSPLLREVLVARYLIGESCAEIGRRYRRTEQTISGWVREASRQMKLYLDESTRDTGRKEEHED
jgi:RNA polymerase sigma-70 factor (ECF subfamily)